VASYKLNFMEKCSLIDWFIIRFNYNFAVAYFLGHPICVYTVYTRIRNSNATLCSVSLYSCDKHLQL